MPPDIDVDKILPKTLAGMDKPRVVEYCRKISELVLECALFGPNTRETREWVGRAMANILSGVMERGVINDYAVACDDDNNPPEVVDGNKLYMDVAVQLMDGEDFVYIPAMVGPA